MTEIKVASSIRFIIKEYLSNLDFDIAELSCNNNNLTETLFYSFWLGPVQGKERNRTGNQFFRILFHWIERINY